VGPLVQEEDLPAVAHSDRVLAAHGCQFAHVLALPRGEVSQTDGLFVHTGARTEGDLAGIERVALHVVQQEPVEAIPTLAAFIHA